jgi:hypothetical protein
MNNSKILKIINQNGGDYLVKINYLEDMIDKDDNSSEYVTDFMQLFQTSSESEGGKGKKGKGKKGKSKKSKKPKKPKKPKKEAAEDDDSGDYEESSNRKVKTEYGDVEIDDAPPPKQKKKKDKKSTDEDDMGESPKQKKKKDKKSTDEDDMGESPKQKKKKDKKSKESTDEGDVGESPRIANLAKLNENNKTLIDEINLLVGKLKKKQIESITNKLNEQQQLIDELSSSQSAGSIDNILYEIEIKIKELDNEF